MEVAHDSCIHTQPDRWWGVYLVAMTCGQHRQDPRVALTQVLWDSGCQCYSRQQLMKCTWETGTSMMVFRATWKWWHMQPACRESLCTDLMCMVLREGCRNRRRQHRLHRPLCSLYKVFTTQVRLTSIKTLDVRICNYFFKFFCFVSENLTLKPKSSLQKDSCVVHHSV